MEDSNVRIDLSGLFQLRSDFIVIAVTGRTGAGSTEIAEHLCKPFNDGNYPKPLNLPHNSYRKYSVIYEYVKENFDPPFTLIRYRDVLLYLLLNDGIQNHPYFKDNDNVSSIVRNNSKLIEKIQNIEKSRLKGESFKTDLYELFFENQDFNSLKGEIFNSFNNKLEYIKFLGELACVIRQYGNSSKKDNVCTSNLFTIVEVINDIIKAVRTKNNNKARVVVDSLRNPHEVNFFKQRYAAFYLFAINKDETKRIKDIEDKYENVDKQKLFQFINEEYKGGKGQEFYKTYIRECLEKADIHINNIDDNEAIVLNESLKEDGDNTSPFFSWKMQLLKYVALISHPGLVGPTPEERCMQIAYTAKYNSGCISRQVGAVVADSNYSVRSVGWNNTPEGQIPCNLRSVVPLLNNINSEERKNYLIEQNKIKINKRDWDLQPFTQYELLEGKFHDAIIENYNTQLQDNSYLKGRNVCFCFRTIKNSYDEGKNQVHTRSLHAEESAFLQIAKYGGQGIQNGKLFTTASPCELCSKKAYQLGIKVIYYIDPYPGISEKQILKVGFKAPEIRLFTGAIGSVYHWLYEPFIAYKDELSLLLGQNISNYADSLENEIKTLKEENEKLKQQLSSAKG